jgi:urease accessory protein
MGAPSARITAQDFLTPPELADWSLASNAAGRIGGVRLELLNDAGGTCLGESYQQVPLRVLPPFRFGAARPSLLYLLNPTAGLMDGDAQLVQLVARSGSKVVVTGQSATRIHPSLRGFCTQQWDVRVEPRAVLVVLPGPAIPFQGCRYYQRVNIHLEEDADLIWGDLWFAGRYARGVDSEQFQFKTIIQDLTVKRKGRLVFRDRFCWHGPWYNQTAAWHFGGNSASSSLFITKTVEESPSPCPPPTPLCVSPQRRGEIQRGGWRGDELESAHFSTGAGDTCIRFLGSSELVTKALVNTALRIAAVRAGGRADLPWLLPSHDLAPNHWFHGGQVAGV